MRRFPWLVRGMAVARLHNRLMVSNPAKSEGFDRLERLLLSMRAGDDLTVHDAATATGLTIKVCQAVLERLALAGLMTHADNDRFVRKTLDLLQT
jgi:hypothetical protein